MAVLTATANIVMLYITGPELVRKYITPLKEPDWDKGLLQFYRAQAVEAVPGEQLIDEVRVTFELNCT
jgi:hypothetical protein